MPSLNGQPFELTGVKIAINTLPGKEFMMRSFFDNGTLVDHQHLVGIADGAEAVGDSLRKFLIKTFLEKHFQKRLVRNVTLIGEHLEMIEHRLRQPE
jgi:hypothetical protein